MMKKNKTFVKFLWNSRGITLTRSILTVVYAASFVVDLIVFAGALKDHTKQLFCIIGLLIFVPLFLRSFKRMFDHRQREAIYEFIHRLSIRINDALEKFGRKILKWLGIDKILRYGKDERSFIFRERKKGVGKKHKLLNTMVWEEQEANSDKVRYIFTDYMISKIKEGYRLRQSETPTDMEVDLAHSDEEHLLFDTYTIARYSGGREEITDETVEVLNEINPSRKRRIRKL